MSTRTQVDVLRTEAKFLRNAIRRAGDPPSPEELDTAARFLKLYRFKDHTPEDVIQQADMLTHREALLVLALEQGFESWEELIQDLGSTPASSANPEIDMDAVLSGRIPWSLEEYLAVKSAMDDHPHRDSADKVLDAITEEVVRASSSEDATVLRSHVERFQNIQFWLHVHRSHLGRGRFVILSDDGESVVKVAESLLKVLCSAPYTVSAFRSAGNPWQTFDIHQVLSDAGMRSLGWEGEIPYRAVPRKVDGRDTMTSLLAPGERPTGFTSWFYALPGKGEAIKLTRKQGTGLMTGELDVQDAPVEWKTTDGRILLAATVVLMVAREPRFFDQAVVLEFPADDGLAHPMESGAPWGDVSDALLERVGGVVEDRDRLGLFLSRSGREDTPVSVFDPRGPIMMVYHMNAVTAPNRRFPLWDIRAGRLVAPGVPMRASEPDDEEVFSAS